jgi:hypothetical protein
MFLTRYHGYVTVFRDPLSADSEMTNCGFEKELVIKSMSLKVKQKLN